MWKLSLTIITVLSFSGCSYFTFNAAMCESITSDPNTVVPEECRNYVEEEAQKAFDNNKDSSLQSQDDVIEFNDK